MFVLKLFRKLIKSHKITVSSKDRLGLNLDLNVLIDDGFVNVYHMGISVSRIKIKGKHLKHTQKAVLLGIRTALFKVEQGI